MVEKIIYYEQQQLQKDWRQNVLLVADDHSDDYEAVFETINEDAIALLPSKMVPLRGYLASSTPLAIANFIVSTIGTGALIVNYSGHGGLQSWADETLFATTDVDGLGNFGKYPFVVSMSCLTGNFGTVWASGEVASLAETLLRAEAKGAVAALMPTGLSTTGGQHILNTALFEALFVDDIRELGAAILSAKQTLLANGGGAEYEQISQTFLLFGDPATALRIPLPRMPKNVSVLRLSEGQVRIRWDAALDSNGNPVAGYNIYRASAPAGPYSKLNTQLITTTQFIDSSGALSISSGSGGGSTYYAVTSEDGDGDESVQSLGISPAAIASAATGPVAACFIK
jgi:hypothetical protein